MPIRMPLSHQREGLCQVTFLIVLDKLCQTAGEEAAGVTEAERAVTQCYHLSADLLMGLAV